MNTQQTLTAAAGISLAGLNFWTGPQRDAFTAGALTNGASSSKEAAAHRAVVQLAGELLFVGVAVLIAGASPSAGSAMFAVIAALWILYLIKHPPKSKG